VKGIDQVISVLNEVLCAELTGINQYFIHSKMLKDWGYTRLAEHAWKESIEEMKHADEVIERILFLEGVPNMQKYMKVNVGAGVEEQHRFDLELENHAVANLNSGISLCREAGDNGTRDLLERILVDEEDHVDWLETQLRMIGEMGLQNYLVVQVKA
jgi:bacterioferritin